MALQAPANQGSRGTPSAKEAEGGGNMMHPRTRLLWEQLRGEGLLERTPMSVAAAVFFVVDLLHADDGGEHTLTFRVEDLVRDFRTLLIEHEERRDVPNVRDDALLELAAREAEWAADFKDYQNREARDPEDAL
jgi:hypothetical protein